MPERPDPDALLAQVHEEDRPEGRGRLKVYLGMAAGVGKTYSMLADGQEALKRCEDVVIGYVEPHGRPETEAMSKGLERLSLRQIEHKGVRLTEFDLDAALARKPGLILVDELAHTNAAGSRHKKRWQDVEELLQAGINVYTTINIQHLSSLNDVVAQITGIVVSETVPDSLINEAYQVELIDIPPEELIKRLHEGKIYVPAKVEQALKSFFKKGNLLALRELALRHTAERVDEQVRTYRAAEGASEPWHTKERILVCVAPNKLGAKVVRSARRMANSLHGELIALYVESSRQAGLSDADRARASEALRLAEDLGAETVTLSGPDIVAEVIRFAQARNVTTIIVGKPIRPRWREILFGSVVDSLVRASGDIDVHVITGTGKTGTPYKIRRTQVVKSWSGYIAAIAVTGLASLICVPMYDHFDATNLVMVYLIGVTFVASRWSGLASTFASLLSVAAFDYFFVKPRGSFAFSDVQYLLTFGVMLVVGLLISTLTARLRGQSIGASERERRTAALYDLSKKLSSTRSRTEISTFAAEKIQEVFGGDVAVMIRSRKSGNLFVAPASKSGFESNPNEQAVAAWVLDHRRRAGRGTDTLPGSTGLYMPLNAENGCVGVLALAPDFEDLRDPSRMHLLETFANQLAVAIERTNLAKDSHEASLTVEQERLRNSLLSSVSHDLRTPLAVISGAASGLEASTTIKDSRDKELVSAISEEANRLERQVRNLLDMTRIEAGAIELKREWQSLEEIIGSALIRTESLLGAHQVNVFLPDDLPLLLLDGILIEQTLVNVLENAARHTPAGTRVVVSAALEPKRVVIEIANDGPELQPGDEERIFEKFNRRQSRSSGGFGLGLAICRAILEAHGGSITARNRPGHGVVFRLELPRDGAAPTVTIEEE